MAKIKQSPKLPAEERRQQLLVAAKKLFLDRGYRDTTTEAIAREVGLTKGAIYFHFKSKEDILYALVDDISEKHRAIYDELPHGSTSPAEILRIFLKNRQKFAGNKFKNAMDFWGQAMAVPRIKRLLQRRTAEGVDRFVEAVDPKYGRSREELKQLAIFTMSLLDGLMVRSKFISTNIDLDKQVRLYSSLVECYSNQIRARKR